LVNGGLNISELDGWWAEAYAPEVGWALGDGREHGEDPRYDAYEAEALYHLLEHEVLPAFYTRNEADIPLGWVARMRESMARLTPLYSTNRSLPQYVERYYIPLAEAWRARTGENGARGRRIIRRRRRLDRHWPEVFLESVDVESDGPQHLFQARVWLGMLSPEELLIELYADGASGEPAVRQTMTRSVESSRSGIVTYETRITSYRPTADFTVRLRPALDDLLSILEEPRIQWQDSR